jgi:hypothetical protein
VHVGRAHLFVHQAGIRFFLFSVSPFQQRRFDMMHRVIAVAAALTVVIAAGYDSGPREVGGFRLATLIGAQDPQPAPKTCNGVNPTLDTVCPERTQHPGELCGSETWKNRQDLGTNNDHFYKEQNPLKCHSYSDCAGTHDWTVQPDMCNPPPG